MKTSYIWKRHKTPRSLMDAFVKGMKAGRAHQIGMSDGSFISQKVFIEHIKRMGMWGFAASKPRPKEIHYWYKKGQSKEAVAFLLGHEVGHHLGKPVKGWKEEHRADTYGTAVVEVLLQLGLIK